ncbi:MAG: hypothetical protein CM15mP120_20540 [Pseudomonadota bacterium]|nr:MAG: hypothetical protein CM15mP120_20540 [Pseudomonadota bacterium]
MLSKADDFPIHQNPEPIAYAGVSRNFYDRYFLTAIIWKKTLFRSGNGNLPQLDVMDAVFRSS